MRKFWDSPAAKVIAIALLGVVVIYAVMIFSILPNKKYSDITDEGYRQHNITSHDTISFTIIADNTLNTGSAQLLFAKELITKFCERYNCEYLLSVEDGSQRTWEDLVKGNIDVIVFNAGDSIDIPLREYIEISVPIENDYVCALRYDDELLINAVNYWISHYRQTSEYKTLLERTHKRGVAGRYNLPITRYSISRYDSLIKKYSEPLGWDWRLLAALIYQESKFNNGAVSHRGAIGLMQIMEVTAERFGVTDIYDPEQNIKAGVKLLAYLQKIYKEMGVEEPDLLKITLGGYNAGEGRIEQLMNVASAEGLDPLVWDNLLSIIPLMKYGYNKNGVTASPFNGKEMITHVEKIENQYILYCRTVEK